MSGGFFRGTSADQDTRFSNKQAKLMKSQKFAPELEHLVDITKVKMDVIRPWIANRVTELLGFEDEVLINFIYGLLEGKVVNGKEVQISLTGFMEKNTGKFMKELWTLLLSAQKNASGVPQQILDAKEEETRQKKAEADRIANEIQKKREKESREIEQERLKKMDGGAGLKATDAVSDPTSKHGMSRASGLGLEDEKETNGRNGARGRNSGSPSRSMSKSFSNSRSYSDDKRRSRSVSKSPEARGCSISSERAYRSPRRSISPRGRHARGSPSPVGRRTSYSRRRSRSRSRSRSFSPVRRRLRSPVRRRSPSPFRRRSRRSPSPVRRRSPSPVRRRYPSGRRSPSPVRRRSPSPVRRRSTSPVRRRSPSPVRRRSPSPVRRRSPPMRRRFASPMRRRSPSPVRRRSPFYARRRSPSPLRRRYRRSSSTPRRRSPSPRRRSPSPLRRRSPSPDQGSSPSQDRHKSLSPVRRGSPAQSSKERNRTHGKLSPAGRRPSSSLRSPHRDLKAQKDPHKKISSMSPSSEKSPNMSDARSASEDKSPVRQTRDKSLSPPHKFREEKPCYDSQETSNKDKEKHHSRDDGYSKSKSSEKRSLLSSSSDKRKDSSGRDHLEEHSPERLSSRRANESRSRLDRKEWRNKDQDMKSENSSRREGHPESSEQDKSPGVGKSTSLGERRQVSYTGDGQKFDKKSHSHLNSIKERDQHKSEAVPMSVEKLDHNNRSGALDSGSEESDRCVDKNKEKRKHKRSEREDASDDYSDDSEIEDRKEAKKRKKEEKKLRKEEKRRRREERRRKREERRAEKHKLKNQSDDYSSDGNQDARRKVHRSDDEEAENVTDQKRLEIELREKALETLKAKKGMGQ